MAGMVEDTAKSRRRERRDPYFLVGNGISLESKSTASKSAQESQSLPSAASVFSDQSVETISDGLIPESPVDDGDDSVSESMFEPVTDPMECDSTNKESPIDPDGVTNRSILESTISEETCVLICRATSLKNYRNLDDENSVESMVARSRSKGVLDSVSPSRFSAKFEFDLGQIKVDSGYVMHFIDEKYTDLHIYDILKLPDVGSKPVKMATLDTLPHHAVTTLQRDGHIKFTAKYDRSTKEFYEFQYGWSIDQVNPADEFAEMLLNSDEDKLASFAYYFIQRFASDHYATSESIAEIRDIKPSSVVDAIKKAEEILDKQKS